MTATTQDDPLAMAERIARAPEQQQQQQKQQQQPPSSLDEKKKVPMTTDLELIPSEKDGEIIIISEAEDYSPAEYKKILRKIDRFLLPLMWFCYGIQQTDKTSLGTQAIFGLRTDTKLVGQQYSWLTTIFYITYMIGEFPSNFLLQRWSLGRSLSIYMFCWGMSYFFFSFFSFFFLFFSFFLLFSLFYFDWKKEKTTRTFDRWEQQHHHQHQPKEKTKG